jgi:tetratricopeptide (TPR) repeat protein
MKSGRIFFGLIFFLVVACPALAQEVGKIISMVGTAEVLRQERWQSVSLHEALLPGDVVRTGPGSRLAVLLADGSQLKVNANSQLLLKQVASPTRHVAMRLMQSLLRLFRGEIWIRSLAEPLEIETFAAVATIRGTELNLAVEPVEAARLTVVEGVVEFRNPQGSVSVAAKEQAIAKPGEAPRKVVIINPRDAVQWALYYPPLIDYRQVIYPEGPDAQAIRRALEHYRRGALPETLRSLEQVPPERRDARFFTLRAGLLLSVSQVAEARADIAEALRRNPSEATAHALRSIIALVQNQKEEALRLARQAAALEPQSPVPQVALSYAYQAAFELDKALDSIKQAVKLAPEDALIQARLAELEFSRGELDRALEAAQRTVALDPELARTYTVLGFAYLTQVKIAQAKAAFEKAITLDSADPLPRLGLGLAKIRESNLAEGTHEIEIAVSLDPNNSLIHSYLGKAYYEQKQDKLAARELAMAKELDPRDPTPFFYDAIRKQTVNRPVEALQDLQRSIELNDNRAVYRSSLLLDEDLAARSTSLGRIYRDLEFEQLALVEGWKSISIDPSNYSAHRLLADSYSALPRHEVARVSEILQSQLLQPLSITPVQPQLAESNLFILEGSGPADPAFNEFNPLFMRNRLALQASAVVGSNDTYGDEVTQSGLWDEMSYSFGQFHYETNGFRDNNDLKHDIYNVFVQSSISPQFSLQAEARHRETEHGDIESNFDLDTFNPFFRRNLRTDTVRVGAHYTSAPRSNLIVSAIYQDEREQQQFSINSECNFNSRGYIAEAQYLFRMTRFDLVAGGGYYTLDSEDCFNPDYDTQHSNGYLYAHIRYPTPVTWTIGFSVDSLNEGILGTFDRVNPKFGMLWNLNSKTTLRLAAFRTLKRSILTDQTIEPTQVAGFNQFFDDAGGAESRRYGVALDHRFSSSLYGGVEVSKRDLIIALAGENRTLLEDWEEELYRAYLNWIPRPRFAVSVEYQLEHFDNEDEIELTPDTRTHIVPLTLRYFDPSGIFSSLVTTYVNQTVDFGTEEIGDDEFVLIDAAIGYRLPKRYGVIKIQVKNLFDEDFNYQDLGLRTLEREVLPFLPERTISAQITLAF